VPRSILLSALAVAALTLTACGSSGPSAEDEAGEAAVRALEIKDAKLFCRQLVSDRLIDEVFLGKVSTCVKSSTVEDNARATASEVSLDGSDESRAEVAVAIEGGQLEGSSGHVELVREGDRWLLDRFGDDYLRSVFLTAIERVDGGALATPAMKACVGGQAEELGNGRIREITHDAIVGGEALIQALLPLAENCPEALAEYGAKEISDALFESGKRSPAFIRCIRKELETGFLLTGIAPDLIGENPDSSAVLGLEALAASAKQSCQGGD
jgi:hypothetical protein